ncbi:MAG: trypsin-like peptidase domain-containing protein [Burkholderiales bacterium]|nr:trypsin-like peptidase domain-containing protein [Burkholderiales bacterium]
MKPGHTLYDALGLDVTATPTALLERADALRTRLLSDSTLSSEDRENRLKVIQYAREVFADPAKRDRYDQSLRRAAGTGSAAPPGVAATTITSGGFAGSSWRTWFVAALLIIAMLVAYLVVTQRRSAAWQASASTASAAAPSPVAGPVADLAPAAARIAEPGNNPSPLTSSGLTDGERSPADVFRVNAASVVVVRGQRDGRGTSQGSGVVIGADTVITNCHVALGTTDLAVVRQGRSYPASIRYRDQGHDLCQLAVPNLAAPAVLRGRVADLAVGARVYAIGAPQGLDLSLSEGIVASLRRFDDASLIQTTAAISPGSSGGGLFDGRGRLVGITTFQSRSGQNLNFAVPVDWIDTLPARHGNADSLLPDGSGASGLPEAIKPRVPGPAIGSQAEARQRLLRGAWHCHAGAGSAALAQYEFGEDGSAVLRLRPTGGEWQTLRGAYWTSGADTLALGPSPAVAPAVQLRVVEVSQAQAVFQWLGASSATHYCSRPAR